MAATYTAQQIADKIQDAIYAAYADGLPIVEYYNGPKRVRKDLESARKDLEFWRGLAKQEVSQAQGIVTNYASFRNP